MVQRAARAEVSVDGETIADIGPGRVVFAGAMEGDTDGDIDFIARKVCELRVFPDEQSQMNRSVQEAEGSILLVPNFTLAGDCRKGRRPSFSHAAPPDEGRELFEQLVEAVAQHDVPAAAGVFGAQMRVSVENDGPVTILLDSRRQF